MKKQLFGLFSAALILGSSSVAQANPQQEATDAFLAFEKSINSLSLSEAFSLLPASQRQIYTEQTRKFAESVGKDVWTAGRKALYTIAATGVKQAHMVLNDPQYGEMVSQSFKEAFEDSTYASLTKEETETIFVNLLANLGALAKNATYENVCTKPITEILPAKPLSMKGVTDKLPPISTILNKPEVIQKTTVVSNTKVEFQLESDPEEPVTFVKVDGKWIPEDIYFSPEEVAECKAGIQSLQLNDLQKNALVSAFRTVTDVASEIGKATNGESLTKIIELQQPKFLPIMMQLSMAFSGPGFNAIEEDEDEDEKADFE